MNIKVVAAFESAGSRHTAAAAVIVVATVMFAAQLAAAQQVVQQVALKAGRLPRVYNALITTDQRLLPSQAEPIVTPVFRPFQFLYEWPEMRYAAVEPYPSSRSAVEVSGAEDESRSVAAVVENNRPVDSTVVKNNRPADSSVPDVPPPPLPVARAPDAAVKKRPEEYPPAPGGFAI
ncbi:uncharacterized protein LOC132920534 isoform X1 [Rhopalosiphum padi]|uniref:uncharacterized protein LOC132920534 isoform X1 n=2 Tax=Rhopalosiphum padi TaxID=40932 RepID=UPI00298E9D40|nr:uncharacterized protein LOC132920534 isoform X1 [Rhopalosiphum padi]